MSEENPNPGETPVNQGGGTAPQPEPQPTDDAVKGETPVNQGGGT